MKKSVKIILTCATGLSVVLVAVLLVRSISAKETVAPVQNEIVVETTTTNTNDLIIMGEYVGKVEPCEQVIVYPKVSGEVLSVYFSIGDQVKAGDLLFALDDSDARFSYQLAQNSYDKTSVSVDTSLGSGFESGLLSAEAALKNAQQTLNSTRQNLNDYNDTSSDELIVAQKKLDATRLTMDNAQMAYDADPTDANRAALDLAEAEYSLARSNYNDADNDSDPELRGLRNSYQSAQSDYKVALEKYNLLKGASRADTEAAAEVDLESASLSIEKSANDLDKYKGYAPITGVIETRSMNPHDMASTQAAAFVISNKDAMTVAFQVSETTWENMQIGDQITVEKQGQTCMGTITEISTMVNVSGGLYTIKATVESAPFAMNTGSTVKVYAQMQKAENATTLPIDAVYYDSETAYLYLYDNGVAKKTVVETGIADTEQIAITSGLNDTDLVITTWSASIADGVGIILASASTDGESVE